MQPDSPATGIPALIVCYKQKQLYTIDLTICRYSCPCITIFKTGTYNRPGLKYISGFIFWIEKQAPMTGQVTGIYQALYFG